MLLDPPIKDHAEGGGGGSAGRGGYEDERKGDNSQWGVH